MVVTIVWLHWIKQLFLNNILIIVKKQNGKYSIIKNYTTSELQELGFTNSQINSMKKISIYDELMINPDLSEVEQILQ